MRNSAIVKITPIDYSILGLVRQGPMSGYAIRMVFQKTALGNFSSSPGTIYPALKRLERLQLLERKTHDNSKKNLLFAITKRGIGAMKEWLLMPVKGEDVAKNLAIILLRFAFMDGAIATKQKLKFLIAFSAAVSKYIEELEAYHAKESKQMLSSGRQAFEHGIESYKATLRWIRKTISSTSPKQNNV